MLMSWKKKSLYPSSYFDLHEILVSYSRSDCSLYYRLVFTGGKGLNASSISVRTQGPNNASYNLTGSSAQQSGHGIGVTEEANILDFSLGSYASKTSITERTHTGCTKAKPTDFRSRSSSQQISGMNKSQNKAHRLLTIYRKVVKMQFLVLLMASHNLQKGEDAVPRFVDASDKLVDAVETSQRLSDRIGESQAISSNEGVLKPVNIAAPRATQSRSGSPKESALGVVNLENACGKWAHICTS